MCAATALGRSLETELIDRHSGRTRADAHLAMLDFREAWYNPQRRHSFIRASCRRRSTGGGTVQLSLPPDSPIPNVSTKEGQLDSKAISVQGTEENQCSEASGD